MHTLMFQLPGHVLYVPEHPGHPNKILNDGMGQRVLRP